MAKLIARGDIEITYSQHVNLLLRNLGGLIVTDQDERQIMYYTRYDRQKEIYRTMAIDCDGLASA
uniref:hypothetical protein n=1 Tax=Rhizobium rhizogenes TaxID=359 RepID=UPI0019106AF9|nr:hypothetical protein [Rhizobium rhizogenes]